MVDQVVGTKEDTERNLKNLYHLKPEIKLLIKFVICVLIGKVFNMIINYRW